MTNRRGFTLIELLIVIAIIAVVAVIVFVTLNPAERFRDSRNSRRWNDIRSIVDAVRLYQFDHKGQLPAGVDSEWRMLGTDISGCGLSCVGIVASTPTSSSDFVQNDQSTFGTGVYNNTVWDSVNSWIKLVAGSNGTYSSAVLDAVATSTWSSFSWMPQSPYGKELPDNKQSESGYPSGNANMTGNILLMHLNELGGATSFADSSGSNNGSTCAGTACPTTGGSGKFNTAATFDGVNDCIAGSSQTNFTKTENHTYEAWIKLSAVPSIYALIIDNRSSAMTITKSGNVPKLGVLYGNGGAYNGSPTALSLNTWYHVVVSYTGTTGVWRFYINGKLDSTATATSVTWNRYGGFRIGCWSMSNLYFFPGVIDEVSIYSRTLPATEILDHYKRGANRLKFQVRSCDDNLCSGESFVGPSGSSASYYTESGSSSLTPPVFNLSGISDNHYFQYRATFETDNTTYSPQLKSVNIGKISSMTSVGLPESCLDLSTALAKQLPRVPTDPQIGSDGKTYYAIRKNDNKQVEVRACGAEGEAITVSR